MYTSLRGATSHHQRKRRWNENEKRNLEDTRTQNGRVSKHVSYTATVQVKGFRPPPDSVVRTHRRLKHLRRVSLCIIRLSLRLQGGRRSYMCVLGPLGHTQRGCTMCIPLVPEKSPQTSPPIARPVSTCLPPQQGEFHADDVAVSPHQLCVANPHKSRVPTGRAHLAIFFAIGIISSSARRGRKEGGGRGDGTAQN